MHHHHPSHPYPDPLKSKRAPRYRLTGIGRGLAPWSLPTNDDFVLSSLRLHILVSRTNKRDALVLAVGRAWRFHPQNGCEIARALDSPFKINGRINSRGVAGTSAEGTRACTPSPSFRRPHANFPSFPTCAFSSPRVYLAYSHRR